MEASSRSNTKKGKGKGKDTPQMMKCPLCPKVMLEKDIVEHQSCHNGKYHTCQTCDIMYPTKSDLWSHQEEKNHK